MLEAVEKALQALPKARTDSDFVRIIGDVAGLFGFRSAFIFQYATELRVAERIIDTDARRLPWWPTYFKSDLRPAAQEVLKRLVSGPILRSRAGTFPPEEERVRKGLSEYDLIDVTTIPINFETTPVGVVCFCGDPPLTSQDEMALQVVVYAIFAQLRSVDSTPLSRSVSLTPREREVIGLSAEGLTSVQIAEKLGMSARTANQHIDNVADKLGKRNRAHTVAEAIRNNLLTQH